MPKPKAPRPKARETERKETQEEVFITTISLPKETHLKLRHLALDEGKNLRSIIREAIDQYLATRKEKGGGKK